MLRRNSSRNSPGHRLGRSKSASSIKTLVSIDPSIAERDAYIAATLSY